MVKNCNYSPGKPVHAPASTEIDSVITDYYYTDTTLYFNETYEEINNTQTLYIFAGNLRIAKITGTDITYYHKDHLGSTTALTDESGNTIDSGGYLPYGLDKEVNALLQNSSYKFTDQEQDDGTGLYNYDARLYDPTLGQFVMADTIVPDLFNPQSLNRYAYCLNNPIKYTDPTGHWNHPDDSDFSNNNHELSSGGCPGGNDSDNSSGGSGGLWSKVKETFKKGGGEIKELIRNGVDVTSTAAVNLFKKAWEMQKESREELLENSRKGRFDTYPLCLTKGFAGCFIGEIDLEKKKAANDRLKNIALSVGIQDEWMSKAEHIYGKIPDGYQKIMQQVGVPVGVVIRNRLGMGR